ncbi:hypothetical protein B0H16DRAFT_1318348 [Mycena metata]|uniref:Uncharacterized protein n=1 Tax=Mycena metata TaxID=1033252 RepID=A0AAD7N9D3_9AGAR|nr:hypothetical protein B0H16DRAFT_1318348 [Mycena metata]
MTQATFIDQGVVFTDGAGTDNSATIFASMMAFLTNERIAAGKPGLGFLNSLIYHNKGAFNDMQAAIGDSSAC